MKLSVIIPAYNEEDNIADIINRLESSVGIPHELIVVDDHSHDKTAVIVDELRRRYPSLRLVHNPYNKGFANALRYGFSEAKGEAVIPIMGDLCDDLATIEKMFTKIGEGYDLICGSRYIKGGARLGGSKVKGFFSLFVGWSLYYLLGMPTHDIANAFKMYRKALLDSVNTKADGFEISMEITLKAYYAGFKITEVPTVWKEREKGRSSFKMMKLLPNYLRFYLWGIMQRVNSKVYKGKAN